MSKKSVQELCEFATHLRDKQSPVLSLWQTLAEYFYPERADFTNTRNLGAELSDQLVDSYPILVRRDLGNGIAAMLRDGDWFQLTTRYDDPDHEGLMWLQWAGARLKKMLGDVRCNFARATKEADHDFVTFGQPVMQVVPNKNRDGLLFQTWHLRDCSWWDDETGSVEGVVRRWAPTHRQLYAKFPKTVHQECREKMDREPFGEVKCLHISMPSEWYGDDELASRYPYVSVYIDQDHQHLLEETGIAYKQYIVPRFQTISGSPYAYSPATVAGLPDNRTLQAMTFTLLEAAERYARPPILATQQAVRGDINLYADGITWVDKDYDERLGASLRPLFSDKGGFPLGEEKRSQIMETLASAFYLNKLSLPETSREMTAFEVNERMKQYRRENLPLFTPLEEEYNGQLCEQAFQVALAYGLMGSPRDIPESLLGQQVSFRFQSPLSRAQEEEKAQRFSQTSALLREAAEMDHLATANVNFDVAVRDAITGIGAPARWLRSVEEVMQVRQTDAMAQAAQAALAAQAAAPEVATV